MTPPSASEVRAARPRRDADPDPAPSRSQPEPPEPSEAAATGTVAPTPPPVTTGTAPPPAEPPPADRAPWRALRHRSMRWWSAANLVSNAGTWMQLTVQNLLVLEISGSAAATGLSLSVQAAPGLLLGLVGGAVVDSLPRKLTAAVSQAVLGLVAFGTAALIALDLLNMPVLLALAAVTGLIATVDGPACALLGNDLVPTRDVPSAIAVGSMAHSSGRLAGTALAGVAVGLFGTAAAYAANGLSFLCVAAVIPFLRLYAPTPRPERAGRGGRARAAGRTAPRTAPGSSREGLRFFLSRPRLVALMVITGLSAIFGRNYALTLAVLVTGPLASGAGAFGTVSTLLAVGGIVGAVLAGRLQAPSVRLVGALAASGAVLQVGAGLSPSLLVLMLLVVPMSVVESISDTAGTTVLQTDPPAELRGRVLGVWRSASTAWGLAGPALVGVLMEYAGARAALVIGGLVIVTVTAGGWLRHRRSERSVPAGATAPTAGSPGLRPVAAEAG